MDDEFLRQFWEPPRPEFIQAIREKFREKEKPPFKVHRRRRWAIAFLLIIGSITACIFASPKGVSPLGKVEQIIYGKRSPIAVDREVVYYVALEIVPIAEVQQRLPFPFSLPKYVPARFSPPDTANVFLSDREGSLMTEWIGSDGKRIRLFAIYPTDKAIRWPGTARSLQVAGRSVILTTEEEGDIALSWVEIENKVAYVLVAEEGVVTENELIKMLETIPAPGSER